MTSVNGQKTRSSLQIINELALDALALRVIQALTESGLDVLLMKGPVTRAWLYPGGHEHPYTDVDLLVDPSAEDAAAKVLRSLGLRDLHALNLALYRPPSERAWLGAEGVVDLHIGIVGIPPARWAEAWERAASESEVFTLRGRPIRIMGTRWRTLQIALHASQRASGQKAVRDLETALGAVPAKDWRSAATLARELDAMPAFATGLRSAEAGQRLAGELALAPASTTLSVLYSRVSSAESLAIARICAEPPRMRLAQVRAAFRVESNSVSRSRVWYLRMAALSRVPAALMQCLSARWSAWASPPERNRINIGGDGR